MKLTYNEFEILVCIEKEKRELSQREISKTTNLSLGTVNKTITSLLEKKLINEDNTIKLYEDDYFGNFSVYTGQEKSNILALYTINALLPMVLDAYNKNIADSLWSVELKLDFLRTIGEEIKERVQEELDSLEFASEEEEEDEEN